MDLKRRIQIVWRFNQTDKLIYPFHSHVTIPTEQGWNAVAVSNNLAVNGHFKARG
jgi:hypothetical protein